MVTVLVLTRGIHPVLSDYRMSELWVPVKSTYYDKKRKLRREKTSLFVEVTLYYLEGISFTPGWVLNKTTESTFNWTLNRRYHKS